MMTDAQVILGLSESIVAIELRRDADALAALITDDYIGVDPSGALINKQISVGRYRRDDFALHEHGISEVIVKVHGETALEVGIMRLQGSLAAVQFGGRYRYTHFWQKTQQGWKVCASQLTPILKDSEA
jgi:ketosteroid isomerase-like protein